MQNKIYLLVIFFWNLKHLFSIFVLYMTYCIHNNPSLTFLPTAHIGDTALSIQATLHISYQHVNRHRTSQTTPGQDETSGPHPEEVGSSAVTTGRKPEVDGRDAKVPGGYHGGLAFRR
jgi:hypothetical protein